MSDKRFRDKHHLFKARSKGGKRSRSNLLLIWREKHEAFHRLFGEAASIDDAINLLKRVKRAKRTQERFRE